MILLTTVILCYYAGKHRLGASIVVDTGTILPVFARNVHNPLCFLHYHDHELSPDQWQQVQYKHIYKCIHYIIISTVVQVSLMFAGNRAVIGSAIYANNLDLCSWYSFDPPYFYTNRSEILRWNDIIFYEYKDVFCYIISQKCFYIEMHPTYILVTVDRIHQISC